MEITPKSEEEVALVPPQSAELTQSYDIVTGRSDGFRAGDAFVAVVQTDPARNRLIVGIDGAGKEAAQVAKVVRQSVKEAGLNGRVKLKFSKGSAAAADSAATESSSPFFGGSTLSTCTAGFTVFNSNSRQRYLVTAGHCSPNGANRRFTTPGGAYVGQAGTSTFNSGGVSDGDLAFIANGSGTAYGTKVYTGASRDASDSTLAPVVAAYYSGISGGIPHNARGVRTGLTSGWYLAPGRSYWSDGTNRVNNVVFMTQRSGCGSVCDRGLGKGDSGGPLYRSDSNGRIWAAGVFSAILTSTCGQGAPNYGNCSSGWWTSLDTMRSKYPNITIMTE